RGGYLRGKGHGENATAGTNIGDSRSRERAKQHKGLFDDEFRFRPRDQHRRRDEKWSSPEFTRPDDIGGRLAVFASLNPLGELRFKRGRCRLTQVLEERRPIP